MKKKKDLGDFRAGAFDFSRGLLAPPAFPNTRRPILLRRLLCRPRAPQLKRVKGDRSPPVPKSSSIENTL